MIKLVYLDFPKIIMVEFYLNNVLYALNLFKKDKIKFYVYVPTNISNNLKNKLKVNSKVILTKTLKKYSFLWFVSKVLEKLKFISIFKSMLIRKNTIDIILFFNSYYKLGDNFKYVSWIPDFQYFHYPEYFTKNELSLEFKNNLNCIKNSDKIILSSNNALKDFLSKFSTYRKKAYVINFVSQTNIFDNNQKFQIEKYSKFLYRISFIYKNHIVVLKAFKNSSQKYDEWDYGF